MLQCGRQRTPWRFWPVIALLAVVGGVALYYAAIWMLTGLAMGGYVWDTTKYSSGYSEAAFGQVAVGWTKEQVLGKLGEPLQKQTYQGEEGWYYSRKGPYGWRLRAVVFRHGRVSAKEAKWIPG